MGSVRNFSSKRCSSVDGGVSSSQWIYHSFKKIVLFIFLLIYTLYVCTYIISVLPYTFCTGVYRMLICGHWCVQYVHSVVILCTTVYSMLMCGYPSVLVCTVCAFCGYSLYKCVQYVNIWSPLCTGVYNMYILWLSFCAGVCTYVRMCGIYIPWSHLCTDSPHVCVRLFIL